MAHIINMTGLRFGRLVVISLYCAGKTSKWNCLCDCGKKIIVNSQNLRRGATKSCGCLSKELSALRHITHGLTNKNRRLLGIWHNMKQRCFNNKCNRYSRYGGRGIIVCQEWLTYRTFYEWAMSHGYSDGLSIDRIDNNGNYCPENCQWITMEKQAINKSTNRKLTIEGVTKTISEWSKITGIKYETLEARIKRGWPVEKIVKTPVNQNIWRNR